MQIYPCFEWQAPEKPFYFQDDSRNIALVGPGTGAGNPWHGTGSGGMGLPVLLVLAMALALVLNLVALIQHDESAKL